MRLEKEVFGRLIDDILYTVQGDGVNGVTYGSMSVRRVICVSGKNDLWVAKWVAKCIVVRDIKVHHDEMIDAHMIKTCVLIIDAKRKAIFMAESTDLLLYSSHLFTVVEQIEIGHQVLSTGQINIQKVHHELNLQDQQIHEQSQLQPELVDVKQKVVMNRVDAAPSGTNKHEED
eukprot:231936_1